VPVPTPSAHAVPEALLSVTGSAVDVRGRVVVAVRGEVDPYTAPLLAACLDGQIGRRKVRTVIVDLGEVSVLDAAGVAVLTRARRRCHARGARLVVRNGGRHPALEPAGLAPFVVPDDGDTRSPGRRGPVPARRPGRR